MKNSWKFGICDLFCVIFHDITYIKTEFYEIIILHQFTVDANVEPVPGVSFYEKSTQCQKSFLPMIAGLETVEVGGYGRGKKL